MSEDQTARIILIAGYYGYNNAGDEAILAGVLHELRELSPGARFCVLSGNPAATEKLHEVTAIDWSDIPGMVEAVRSAALVVVGGGGLIQDYWGVDTTSFLTSRQGGMSEFGAPILVANLLGVRSMFYSVGVGPLRTPDGEQTARMLFELADRGTVRDENSRSALQAIGVDVKGILVDPDPALRVPLVTLPGTVREQLGQLQTPLVGVSLRYWDLDLENNDWPSHVALGLDLVVEALDATVVFVPFHQSEYYLENDHAICSAVMSVMDHADRVEIVDSLNPLERFALMGEFDLVLGMRLHSLVSALGAGIPSVGLCYDPKVRAFLHDLGLAAYAIDLSELEGPALADHMLEAHENAPEFEQSAEELHASIESGSKSAEAAISLLEGEPQKEAHPAHLVDFVLNQTLNLAEAEDHMARLSKVFNQAMREPKTGPPDMTWLTEQLQETLEKQAALEGEITSTKERMKSTEMVLKSLEKALHETEHTLQVETEKRSDLEQALEGSMRDHAGVQAELEQLRTSRGYRILRFTWSIIWRFRDPRHTAREVRSLLRKAYGRWIRPVLARVVGPLIRVLPGYWRNLIFVVRSHHLEWIDRSTVVLYTEDENLFPGYQPRAKQYGVGRTRVRVSLVTTVRNEADNAESWLRQLEKLKRPPDEVILLEGGSKDNTFEILQRFEGGTDLNLKLVSRPGTNIATRRNLGVSLAQHPIIAMTDFGCSVDEDWLEKIVLPFELNPETDVVAGWYRAESITRIGEWAKHELIPRISDITPQSFLPACRSIAFKKSAWDAAGGFAEWLTKTGEDTAFDMQLKKTAKDWAFVPDAQVVWHAPNTLNEVWDKLYSWTVGDGESGAFADRYWSQIVTSYRSTFLTFLGLSLALSAFWISPLLGQIALGIWTALAALSLAVDGVQRGGIRGGILRRIGRSARVQGYMQGIRNRPEVMARRFSKVSGVVLFLTGVPIDDTGGGARGTQIALELLRRGNLVVFVHKYPKQESTDLELNLSHEHLLHFSAEGFDWEGLRWELQKLLDENPLTCIVEFPFREYLPIARSVAKMGGRVIYDLIDEWNTSLGGEWYSEQVEAAVIKQSDVLVGSAPSLVDRLKKANGGSALWIPNAVNLKLFDRHKTHLPPADLPVGSPRILYIGALWGDWFDWDLLEKIGLKYPSGSVVLVGDYVGQSPFEAENVHFLGLKPQPELPGYLVHSDVAIIPWEISPITQATSPLKIFEYLAMGVPVVAPMLEPLVGIPYVFLSVDHAAFLENIEKARKCKMDEMVLESFLKENSWEARIERLAEVVPGI